MNQKMKAVALCLDYMNRNQESIDYDVANITIELLMSKCCYVEICYFVGALIEQERQLGGVEKEELLQLKLLDDQTDPEYFVGQDMNLLNLYLCVYDMIESNFDPAGFFESAKQTTDSSRVFLLHSLNQNLYPEISTPQQQGEKVCPSIAMLTLIQTHIPIDILIRYVEALMKVNAPKESLLYLLSYLQELDNDDYYDILLDVIEVYSELNEYDLALSICNKVIASENIENKSIILLKIGILYGRQGLKDKEAEAYLKALEWNPEDSKVRFRLSELYESVGKIREALEILETDQFKQVHLGESENQFGLEKKEDGEESVGRYSSHDDSFLDEEQNTHSDEGPDQSGILPHTQRHSDFDQSKGNPVSKGAQEKINFEKQENSVGPRKLNLLHMLHSLNTPEAKEYSMRTQNIICEKIKENSGLNPRTQRRMQNLVENNILYFSNLSRTIKNHLVKCDFDKLLLEFRRCEIKLKSQSEEFYVNAQSCITESLKLELKRRKLFGQIYLNLLRENKGKLQIAPKVKFPTKKFEQPDHDSMEEDEYEDEEEEGNVVGVKREAPESQRNLDPKA